MMATRALEPDEIIAAQRAAPRPVVRTHNSERVNALAFLNELSRAVRAPGITAIEYRRVPNTPSLRDHALWQDYQTWQIVIVPSGKSELHMAYELGGDVVVGSNAQSTEGLDINLAGLDGFEQGVSRRHLLLRPTREKLFLIDLHSTNGTAINGLPVAVGQAYSLADGDLISVGRLHLQIKIARKPEGRATVAQAAISVGA
jgi:FHA domain-containing protein